MKYNESSTNIKHKWNHLTEMFYKRYPNPFSKHVLSEDVISRSLENNVLKTVRLYSKTNETPWWLRKILPDTTACILEESHVNLDSKTIVTYSKNLNLKTFLYVEEKCVFSVSEKNREWTAVHRHAWISSSFYGLVTVFEAFGAKRYSSNIQRMDNGLDNVLQQKNKQPQVTQSFALPISSNL